MFTFRQKIFLTYVSVFLLFLAILFPTSKNIVRKIVEKQLIQRANELIHLVHSAPNIATLIQRLRENEHLLFLRASLFNSKGQILYDSHLEKALGNYFIKGFQTQKPEIIEALHTGTGYSEGYSVVLKEKFVYVAKSFDFHGDRYVMRTAFPQIHVQELNRNFEYGFLLLGCFLLTFSSFVTWFIIHHLTTPIQAIIHTIRPYQEGKVDSVPEIHIKSKNEDDFTRLANTLNELSKRVQQQIQSLISEKNEKTTILESLMEGIIALDAHLFVKYMNPQAQKFLKLTSPSLHFHTKLLDYQMTNDTTNLILNACQTLLEKCKETLCVSTTTISLNHNRLIFDLIAVPEKNGFILVLQDQSSHYKMIEMRKDFIANASHELKTPITIIRGFAEALYDYDHLPQETIKEITGKITNNCIRMDKLVRNLLTLSDTENLPISKLSTQSLLSIFKRCEHLVKSVYTNAEIVYECSLKDDDDDITADCDLLELAFHNLLENAAKYSKPPAYITITIKEEHHMYCIEVKDKGLGIPPQDIDHIFERFYTVNKAHSRKLGGSGLGLSLVQTIMEKHNGKIRVESEVGVGSTFFITIPKSLLSDSEFEEE